MFTATRAKAASQFMDYYTPAPLTGSLPLTCWGAPQVKMEIKALCTAVEFDGTGSETVIGQRRVMRAWGIRDRYHLERLEHVN